MNSQDMYSAIDYALNQCNDDGYLNHFVFVRALNVAVAIIQYPSEVDILEGENVLEAYDRFKEDGTIDKIRNDVDMFKIYDMAHLEFNRYQEHLNSVGGAMNIFMDFVNNKLSQGISELTAKINSKDIQQVQAIAENWGMDNDKPALSLV